MSSAPQTAPRFTPTSTTRMISPDARWWWDGMNWYPMPGILPARRRPGRGALAALLTAGLVVVVLALAALGVVDVPRLDMPWGA